MPVWLTIVLGIVGGLGTIGGICGLTAYINERVKHKAQRLNNQEDMTEEQIKRLQHESYVAELRSIIKDELEPIVQDLKNINADLKQNKTATITSLRSNMKSLRDKYKKQGYADAGDKATWNELYDDYKDMGGNHFQEYVNQWKKEVNDLPLDKKVVKKSKKKVLLENK